MKDGENGKIHFTEQTDRLENSTGGMLSVTLFQVAINGILGKLRNIENESLFADDLAIYITTRKQRVISRALEGVTNNIDAWAAERSLTFSPRKTVSMTFRKRRKKNKEPIEIMLGNKIIPSKKLSSFWG